LSFIPPGGPPPSQADDCSIFEHALDALPDGVLLVNSAREIVYANSAFARLWNVPVNVFASRDDSSALQFVMDQLVDPEGFRQEVERLHHTMHSSEDEIRFKDGRTFSRRSVPFQKRGAFNARIWIFTDVTEARSATLDALTRLPNRLAFSRHFGPYVEAEADGLVRTVAIMDVDNFKKYNDLYGHAAGDQVLRQIGNILRSHLDAVDDMIFRIGGEEFLMATRTREKVHAFDLFEAIRLSIAGMAMEHLGNAPHRLVTASVGLGAFDSAKNPDSVFARIDAALYKAKANGRNALVEAEI
jgi:diguanylate cyclase (GGDEF)-like protein